MCVLIILKKIQLRHKKLLAIRLFANNIRQVISFTLNFYYLTQSFSKTQFIQVVTFNLNIFVCIQINKIAKFYTLRGQFITEKVAQEDRLILKKDKLFQKFLILSEKARLSFLISLFFLLI